MRSAYIWLVASTTGAIIGAVFTHYWVAVTNDPLTGSLAGVNQTESVSRDRNINIPVTLTPATPTPESIARVKTEALPATLPNTTQVKKPDVAEEEAMVQIITSRLYDPSTTLADVMQSEEMLKLSDESRERVVAKAVGMLNRGEIDARVFMSNKR